MITAELITKAMNYSDYKHLLEELLVQGKTTGANQSEEFVDYGKLNLQRMRRLEKTTHLSAALKQKLSNIKASYVWLVITEGWCGDASQNIPVFNIVSKECPHIELKLILRDEHLDVMDLYLTNGSRSIPKLICMKKDTSSSNGLKEVFVWGPRPQALQEIVVALKKDGVSLADKGIITQNWYNADKTLSLQEELIKLVHNL
jgi:Thioredoxin